MRTINFTELTKDWGKRIIQLTKVVGTIYFTLEYIPIWGNAVGWNFTENGTGVGAVGLMIYLLAIVGIGSVKE